MSELKNYVVTGRRHGDDEDVAVWVKAAGNAEAVQQFEADLRFQWDLGPKDEDNEYTWVYVNWVICTGDTDPVIDKPEY